MEFSFRRLLRHAGRRWRYSNSPPHGDSSAIFREIYSCIIVSGSTL
jgi:hypothetical protein